MAAHILISVSLSITQVGLSYSNYTGGRNSEIVTTPILQMQRFGDRTACEHAAKQARALAAKLAGSSKNIQMTCQPESIEPLSSQ